MIPLEKAEEKASILITALIPFCKKRNCFVAGSIRRKKPFVKDIEIVLVRDTKHIAEFKAVLDTLEKIKGDALGKYTQRIFRSIKVDIFMCNEDNLGYVLAIRTGPANFSKYLARRWVGLGFKSKEGYIYQFNLSKMSCYGSKYKFYTEQEFFDFLGLDYIEPEKRI